MGEIEVKDIIRKAKRDRKFKKELLRRISKELINWNEIINVIAFYANEPPVDVFDIVLDEFGEWNYRTRVNVPVDDIIADIRYKLEDLR